LGFQLGDRACFSSEIRLVTPILSRNSASWLTAMKAPR
jgi:PIN domain nuclease of toxin-antitoxin system